MLVVGRILPKKKTKKYRSVEGLLTVRRGVDLYRLRDKAANHSWIKKALVSEHCHDYKNETVLLSRTANQVDIVSQAGAA